ncbi:glycosyl hydrolase [Pontibacter sp. G13]|uniref:glycoside hydrolase family 117 protein n=1 Tax=Pontibacter sp. G13 TaxID=3074898 RepID=UPI00288B63FA|nr:glycosyl hydrolase [Pontibacter sp. G13]WNJ20079.1 glycosyl hydrolase [Pontibacter sp. G13]
MNLSRFLVMGGLIATLGAAGCTVPSSAPTEDLSQRYRDNAISDPDHMSLASKRAMERHYDQGPEWFVDFNYSPLKGDLAPEDGVVRRDPSAIIEADGLYHVYYTKSTGDVAGFGTGDMEAKVFPWDLSDIWHATSEDGWTWKEEGMVVGRAERGRYDDRSVFTPEILAHDGNYILVYQTVKHPYVKRVKNQVGMAIADNPYGPFETLDEPILSPADNGIWDGDDHNDRYSVIEQGDFDSHKVHDPTLLVYKDKFYLYYKGERMGERTTFGGREIKWGVAISDNLTGPYEKSLYNPITNSGHEIAVWPYQDGIAAMLLTDGPERNTLQFAKDGINFEIKSHIRGGPHAPGLVRSLASDENPIEALGWGLTHQYRSYNVQFIKRYDRKEKKAI